MGTMSRPEEKEMAQMKCIYTNTYSMDNKQEEMEAIVQQAGCDLVAITELVGTSTVVTIYKTDTAAKSCSSWQGKPYFWEPNFLFSIYC